MYRKIILLLLLSFSLKISTTDLTISQPGIYRLGDNLLSTPASAGGIINITSGNVFLDLNNHKINQINATATVDGVTIGNGLSNIVIQNGTISGVTRSGIRVGSSCSNIRVFNVDCINCAIGGVDFQGAGIATIISNCSVEGCRFFNCSTTVGAAPINLVFCQGCQVLNCLVASAVASVNWNGVFVTSSTNCTFDSISVISNSTTLDLNGFEFSAGAMHTISNCVVENCSAGGNLSAYRFDSSTTNNSIMNCQAIANSASSGSSLTVGFYVTGATACMFKNCAAASNTSGNNVNGFRFDTTPDNCTILNSQSNSNVGAQAASGYLISTGARGIVIGCSATSNAATPAGTANGVSFANGTSWSFSDVVWERNTGVTASFGFNLTTATTGILFLKALAFNNGTTLANQISFPGGIYNGTIFDPLPNPPSSSLNSVPSPWTNIRIQN